ncbi:MAG: cytochrome P450, partial [Omnitrophica WOR_2 bacterium]
MSTPSMSTVPGRSSPFMYDVIAEMRKKGFLGFFTDVWKQSGDISRVQIGKRILYLAVHPEHVRYISITNRQNYDKLHSYENVRQLLLGNGLVASRGDLWRRQRRLMAPFFTPRNVEAYYPVIVGDAQALIERWDKLAGSGKPVEMGDEMMRVTAAIILRSMFTSESDEGLLEMKSAVETMIRFTTRYEMTPIRLPLWVPIRKNLRYRAARRRVHSFIDRIIAGRRSMPAEQWPGDLLSRMMSARDEETGLAMPENQLRDESITIFFAGHETTARTLTFMWHALAQNPQVSDRLHAEIDTVLAGRTPTIEDLERLPYTLQVIKETLRLYPPAPVYVRDAMDEDVIDGVVIPKGSRVMLSPFLTHRHPDFWEDPERFDPDRFLPEYEKERHPYAWHPFAAGQRICLGNHFALFEAQLLAAMLASRYAPRAVPGHELKLDMAGTLLSRTGVPM